ncbi:MAG: type IV pilus modification protein PilV [Magnetococcales bacterium]|nr:type IV pilus modification protein PilV [Magnetococcales bacterium]
MYSMRKNHTVFLHNRGFTLIENLIALLILSIGLLGLGVLQLNGLRSSQEAYYRGQATAIAQELSERLHANPTGAVGQFYDLTQRTTAPFSYSQIDCTQSLDVLSAATYPTALCSDDLNSVGSSINGVACTTTQMAEFDTFQVYCQAWGYQNPTTGVGQSLPGLQISVSCSAPCTATSAQTIQVAWQRFGWKTLAADASCPVNTECVSINVVP